MLLVFPNLTAGNVHVGCRYNALIVVECNLQVREAIMGFKERRGPNELTFDYPLDPLSGCYFDQSRFTRNYFTTGIILTHPILNSLNVRCDVIANLLFESFLLVIPFERRDINFASDRHRVGSGPINEGDRFVSIHDQTYGSLRLSGRLLEEHVLRPVLEKCVELAQHPELPDINGPFPPFHPTQCNLQVSIGLLTHSISSSGSLVIRLLESDLRNWQHQNR